ncbi:unnamed protein product [Protopolystoma xenopodis]|uniref:Uncharacterized protein n=1 Tax=Protopolystoma xenopodis TaxID=117903 RepID=A0A3S5CLS5_9PLAT|nr:unnamed protein product [Protopolystoma xenopodis]
MICLLVGPSGQDESPKCSLISVRSCACPPPYVGRNDHKMVACGLKVNETGEIVYGLPVDRNNQPVSRLLDAVVEAPATPCLPTDCQPLYKWCEWGVWTAWSRVCGEKAYQQRRRYRGCCELAQWKPELIAHACSSHLNLYPRPKLPGKALERQTRETTKSCTNLSQLLASVEGKGDDDVEKALLGLAVISLVTLIVSLVLVVYYVRLE